MGKQLVAAARHEINGQLAERVCSPMQDSGVPPGGKEAKRERS